MSEETYPSPSLSLEPDGLARVTLDDPERKVNVLTEAVMTRLADAVAELREGALEGRVRAVLVASGKPSSFIAGADLDHIARIESPEEGAEAARRGQAVYLDLERLPVPTLAAVHGTCLGGGTELALACRYRVASDHPDTKLGLPEVQLGILPAWGGTTRLPRLIGLQAALDLLLTGRTVNGRKARSIGLVEEILPHERFLETAEAFLRERLETGDRPTGAKRGLGRRLLEDTAPGRRIVLSMARRKVAQRTGGHYPAPIRILDVLQGSLGEPVERALEAEARAAGELLASPVCKNLLHVFRLRERARRGVAVNGLPEPLDVADLGVIGAGVMGGGIAQLAAYNGIRVRIKDIDQEPVARALRHARSLFDGAVERGRLSRREAEQGMELVSGGTQYAGIARADLVVEAVAERKDVKREVLGEVESVVEPACVLTTNTSSLSVTELGEGLERPERFAGMHFFNPVHRMPLVEVVRGGRTDDRTVSTVHALALRLGKVPVVVNDGPGFLVNRILGPYLNEAGHLLAAGASVEAVDAAATEFGMPMGPLRLVDEVGVDVMRHAGEALHQAFGDRMAPAAPLTALAETDRRGRKGGLGFYRHPDDGKAEVDRSVYEALGPSVPGKRRDVPPDEIRARLVLAMINEAARALTDGIVSSAADLDLAMIMGTGFPPFRGGLLRFADEAHPRALVERLEAYERTLGPRFAPPDLLRSLVRTDRGFYEAYPAEGV